MTCPKCGAPTQPGAGFCPNCGGALNVAVQPIAPPSLPAKNKNKTLLVVAVVAVVAVVIIATLALALGGSTKAGNNDNTNNDSNTNTDNNDSGTNTNSQITMTVSDVQGYHSDNMFEQPSDGKIFVKVYANITNNGVLSLWVSPSYLSLVCSDGKTYEYTWMVDSFDSGNLPSDYYVSISCGFEIPKGVTPKTFVFNDGTDSIRVPIPLSVIDLTVPEFVHIELVSVTPGDSGSQYITPDPGNTYVTITLTVTNKRATTLELNPYYFTLETPDGLTHDITYDVDYVMPDGLQAGATTTVSVSYEISQSTTPSMLIYDDYYSVIEIDL